MKKSENRSLKLGAMVAVGLLLFSVAVYYLGSKQNLFSSSVTVKTYFQDVKGLMKGNKVQYSGITVGFVSDIEIVEDTVILVEMAVDKDVAKFIRKDSKVEINSDGLMGSKIISIFPGTNKMNSIAKDDILQARESIEIQDVLKEAQTLISESRKITGTLVEISNKINNGEGDIAALLNNNTLTTKMARIENEMLEITSSAQNIMESTNGIVEKINQGEGDLGRLVNDTVFTTELTGIMARIDDISLKTDSVTNELHRFANELNTGNGVLQRLVYDDKMADNIDTSIVKINQSVDDVVDAANTIEKSWIFNLFSKNK